MMMLCAKNIMGEGGSRVNIVDTMAMFKNTVYIMQLIRNKYFLACNLHMLDLKSLNTLL